MQNNEMVRNAVRGIVGLLLAAAATWMTNYIVEKLLGPENPDRHLA